MLLRKIFLLPQFVVSLCFSGHLIAQNTKGTQASGSLKPAQSTKAGTTQSNVSQNDLGVKTKDFIQKMEDGQINWTGQYIEAEGSSVIDTARFKNLAQARLMAQRGAVVDAQRNLLEIMEGVRVEGNTTVKDMITQSDEVKTNVSGLVKGAAPYGKTVYADGQATVKLRIPLYQKGLGNAVVEEALKNDTKPTDQPVVPAEQDTVKKESKGTEPAPKQIVLAVEGKYQPTLFPQLTDDQNQLILDLASKYDPTGGKVPTIVKATAETLKKLKGKKGLEVLEVIQDQAGNFVLTDKAKIKMDKWIAVGKTIWKIVKSIILPI